MDKLKLYFSGKDQKRLTSVPAGRISLCLFASILLIYFGTVNGITCSNDGSHYALVRAIAEGGRFDIGDYLSYTESNDYASRNGKVYSDRPPGTAFAAALLYTTGRLMKWAFLPFPSIHDRGNSLALFAVLTSVLFGTGLVYLFYRLLCGWGISLEASMAAALALALGSPLWKYGAVLFSHSFSAFLVFASYFLAVTSGPLDQESLNRRVLLGLTSGYSVVVEYANIIPVALIFFYMAVTGRLLSIKSIRAALPSGLVMLSALGLLLGYHTVCFGKPLHTAYTYHATYLWAHDFFSTFNGSLIYGLKGFLIGNHHNQGIFFLCPFQLFSVIGFWFFLRIRRAEAILAASILISAMLLMGKHRTFHGFTFDGRYMVPYWTFLCLGLGFGLQQIQRITNRQLRFCGWAVFSLLTCISVLQMAHHIGFSYGYNLELSDLGPPVASRESWIKVFNAVFPNWRNVPVMAIIILLFSCIYKGIKHKLKQRKSI